MGEKAAEMLLKMIKNKSEDKKVMIETSKLISRESVKNLKQNEANGEEFE